MSSDNYEYNVVALFEDITDAVILLVFTLMFMINFLGTLGYILY